ncbi:MAG: hypothetical protein JWN98_341 [Abditibacteriota bacterium]|nr:hypothetical protein [Abditibacteriota bacterium]
MLGGIGSTSGVEKRRAGGTSVGRGVGRTVGRDLGVGVTTGSGVLAGGVLAGGMSAGVAMGADTARGVGRGTGRCTAGARGAAGRAVFAAPCVASETRWPRAVQPRIAVVVGKTLLVGKNADEPNSHGKADDGAGHKRGGSMSSCAIQPNLTGFSAL